MDVLERTMPMAGLPLHPVATENRRLAPEESPGSARVKRYRIFESVLRAGRSPPRSREFFPAYRAKLTRSLLWTCRTLGDLRDSKRGAPAAGRVMRPAPTAQKT